MIESFDTAVFVPGRGLYAFADDLVWRYADGRQLPDSGFPKPITAEFPGAFARALDAAVVHPDGGLYLFRGDQHIRYDVARRGPDLGYPRPYADDWPGVFPNGIDAALTWGPDIIYFFSGGHYTSFSPRRGYARAGFPKAIRGNWPGLGGGPLRAAMTLGDGRRLLLAGNHNEAYDGDGRAISRDGVWPLANSALVEHESPFRTGIPNALRFDSKLWEAFAPRLPFLNVNPGVAGLEDAAMVIVALSANPTDPRPYVGHDATRMFYSGSMLKVAAMYGAYQLRAAVNRLGASLTDGSDAEVFKKVSDALDPQIKDAVPRITSARGIRPDMLTPKYAEIFTIMHGSPIKFAFTDEFRQNLKRMIVGSHNESAKACIRALGYNTINGALQSAGLFTPSTDNGIWLAGDYANWPVVTVKSDNDGQVKQATTCLDMARLLVLINDDNLVEDDVHSHPDTGNAEMRGLLQDAVTDPGARTLLLRPFEPDTTTAPFKVLQSKIGVGQLKGGTCRDDMPKDRCTYSEAAVVQNSAGKKFVVVFQNLVLFKAHPSHWDDGLRNITKVISETIEAFHP
jgi:beta-lactamase class A